MIFLWGFNEKLKKDAYIGIRYCKQYRRFEHTYLVRNVKQFTLFFLPLFQWGTQFGLICSACRAFKSKSKQEYERMVEEYEDFLTAEQCTKIYDYCIVQAAKRENTFENIDAVYGLVKERFDLKGFDDDFKKMIANIFAVQQMVKYEPKIID